MADSKKKEPVKVDDNFLRLPDGSVVSTRPEPADKVITAATRAAMDAPKK